MGAIIWLASYPKSGNTWARNFLHNLLRPKDDTYDINEMNELTTGALGPRWYAKLLKKPLEEASLDEVATVRAEAQGALAAAAEGLVFVKTHSALVTDLGTPAINKEVTAGAIYIVRDPLDVAHSYAHHLDIALDEAIEIMNREFAHTANTKEQVYEPLGSWSQHVRSWTHRPHQALHVMRYEDMLAKPELTFRRLCDFLLLKPTRDELAAALEKSSFERLQSQEEDRGFRERPEHADRFFREGKAGTWRKYLTGMQVRAIVEHHREQMARFGYVPDDVPT
jgi:Sulfotransferase domain